MISTGIIPNAPQIPAVAEVAAGYTAEDFGEYMSKALTEREEKGTGNIGLRETAKPLNGKTKNKETPDITDNVELNLANFLQNIPKPQKVSWLMEEEEQGENPADYLTAMAALADLSMVAREENPTPETTEETATNYLIDADTGKTFEKPQSYANAKTAANPPENTESAPNPQTTEVHGNSEQQEFKTVRQAKRENAEESKVSTARNSETNPEIRKDTAENAVSSKGADYKTAQKAESPSGVQNPETSESEPQESSQNLPEVKSDETSPPQKSNQGNQNNQDGQGQDGAHSQSMTNRAKAREMSKIALNNRSLGDLTGEFKVKTSHGKENLVQTTDVNTEEPETVKMWQSYKKNHLDVRTNSEELNDLLGKAKSDKAAQGNPEITLKTAEFNPAQKFSAVSEKMILPQSEIQKIADGTIARLSTASDGTTTFEMSLNPAELGKITIKLVLKDSGVTAEITAEKMQTAAMLQNAKDNILAAVERAEVRLENITVDYRPDYSEQRENQGQKQPEHKQNEQEETENDGENGISFAELIGSM
ncbi:MAG: flagellar hook-length control protein FliK [Oscillospiraceae bacterium]|nr:flagellar hook-length control protein FliK [Oscillospiraceae bacterium]